MNIRCPTDQSPLLPASLRQLRLTIQRQEDAGFFGASGSVLQVYTCPRCGWTQFYAVPPLNPGPATDDALETLA